MMSPAHVLEPTYQRLKRALMEGAWPSGAKLEAVRLADDFGVSMTPVRDSLNQLVGEGLVDLTPGEGFRAASLSEQGLRDMLYVHALLLETVAGADWKRPRVQPAGSEDYADRLAETFVALAVGSGNTCLAALVRGLGARLHSIRRCEPAVVPGALATLERLERSMAASASERSAALWHYHRQCAAHAASLVSLAARPREEP